MILWGSCNFNTSGQLNKEKIQKERFFVVGFMVKHLCDYQLKLEFVCNLKTHSTQSYSVSFYKCSKGRSWICSSAWCNPREPTLSNQSSQKDRKVPLC